MSLQSEANANWPEDEARQSAKHWNETVRFEDPTYRAQWLYDNYQHMRRVFADPILLDRYCVEFLKHRIPAI
jgi:hypothetical protein